MGYYSRGYGELRLSRPLFWAEFKDSKFARESGEDTIFMFEEEVEDVPVPEGIFRKRSTSVVGWRYDDSVKMYTVDTEISELASLLNSLGVFTTGWLVVVGEEQDDIKRYGVRDDGQGMIEKAVIRWPDGTKFEW